MVRFLFCFLVLWVMIMSFILTGYGNSPASSHTSRPFLPVHGSLDDLGLANVQW